MTEKYTPLDIYKGLHKKNPGTPEGVGWHDYPRQIQRFGALITPIDLKNIHTILDAGCGYGDFYAFLQNWSLVEKVGPFDYTGVDVHDDAIDWAKRTFENQDDEPKFLAMDVRELADLRRKFDLVAASGILSFYPPMDQLQIINRLWQMTSKVLSFNFRESASKSNDFQAIQTWIGFTGSKRWEVSHSYLENDFTVTIWRDKIG